MSKESTQQEPVAWVEAWANGKVQAHEENCFSDDPAWLSNPIPLYTAPPKREWVGLTDEEIKNEWQHLMAVYIEEVDSEYWGVCNPEFARAIEAKLKEKNT